ncbi:MAG: ABC transporter permease [Lachnospiraceae bacterium]|nr:ABC transporter permease [Lachnospiraceae bacterium]
MFKILASLPPLIFSYPKRSEKNMVKYIVKKLLMMIPMLLVISFIVYMGLRATGVDPINFLVSPEVLSANAENVEALRESLGLNDPLVVQYVRWLGDILHGDLGYSLDGTSISATIATRLPYTLELAGYSLLFSTIIGIGIGIISAIRQNGIVDYIGRVLAVIGQAVPQFLVGILLIEIFAIKLGWFPTANRVDPNATNAFVDAFRHLFLPVVTLTIGMVAVLMRYARNTMLDVLNSDYIKTARSKGIPEWKVYMKHGFRNAMKPVLVILLFRIPGLIGGSVVIETVFSYPGIGITMTNAITSGDYPVVLVTTLIIAATMLICSFLVDVFNALLDPRVRLGE